MTLTTSFPIALQSGLIDHHVIALTTFVAAAAQDRDDQDENHNTDVHEHELLRNLLRGGGEVQREDDRDHEHQDAQGDHPDPVIRRRRDHVVLDLCRPGHRLHGRTFRHVPKRSVTTADLNVRTLHLSLLVL